MASCDFLKATHSKASSGGMRVHLENESRELHGHSNTDIDTSKTHLNYCVGCETYGKAIEHLRERTKTVDKDIPPLRIKKDRITAIFIEIPCPHEIADKDLFFKKAYDFTCARLGKENVHGGFVHKDEVHEYVDKDGTIRTSMEHMHIIASPYTAEKGINGKAFLTKTFLTEWNKNFCLMVDKEFGVQYNTHNAPGKKTVEQLKRESEKHEITRLIKQDTALSNSISHKREELNKLDEKAKEQNARIKYGKKRVTMSRDEYLTGYMNAKDYKQAKDELKQQKRDLERKQEKLDRQEQDFANRVNSWQKEEKRIEKQRDLLAENIATYERERANFDRTVQKKAQELKDGRTERLEELCSKVKVNENGESLLGYFEKTERERQQEHSHDFSR